MSAPPYRSGRFVFMHQVVAVYRRQAHPGSAFRSAAEATFDPEPVGGWPRAPSAGIDTSGSRLGSERMGGRWGERGKRYGLGIDVGGTFTDIVVYDAASGRQVSHKELTTHDDPSRGVMAGIDRLLARKRDCASRHRPRGARHHAVQQRADRAQGRTDRAHHDQGLPRHARDRARAQVRALRHHASSSRRPWCRAACAWRCRSGWPSTAACACHSTRPPCLRPPSALGGRGRHLGGNRLPALLRQPGARAAGGGAAGRAPPRASRCRPRSRWRRRSASTSASPRPSSTPTSSRWRSATSPRSAEQIAAAASRRRCC